MTSHIRIPDITPVAQDVADGNRRTFEFPFPIFEAADLDVLVGDATVTAGFVVRGAGSSDGGAVVFATAPAAGLRVTLRRQQTYARTGDLPDEREPTPHELNDAIDQGIAAVQELDERLSRTVRRSPAADLSRAVDLTLPEPEAGRVLGWNGSADGLVNLAQVDTDDMLRKSRNLADLPDKAQARTNLGLGSAALRDTDEFATAAQGAKADSALQSSAIGTAIEAHSANLDWVSANLTDAGKALLDDADATAQRTTLGLAAVAASGSYTDLSNTPALGSAAAHNADEFATAAQGAKADSALQSSAIDTDATLSANSDGRIASQKAVKAYVDGKSSALDADVLHKSQNLADLPDKAQARTNLGLGNAAVHNAGEFATAAQGAKADSALQSSAVDTDTTLSANSDGRIASQKAVKAYVDGKSSALDADVLHKSQNLADLPDKAQARTNLGLGSAATKDAGTAANQLVQLDAGGKLPAVNGSAVTSLNAGALTTGTVASARLGSGTADGSTFLRGDGTWAPLSAISGGVFGNVQTFTASGTFTVPAGVKALLVLCIGGGGGGGALDDQTTPGGTTSFGTSLTANGGYGGGAYNSQWIAYQGNTTFDANTAVGLGTSSQTGNGGYFYAANSTWGAPGTGGGIGGGRYGNQGGYGGVILGLVAVTPGQQISITIGAAGPTLGGAAKAGACVVRW